MIDEWGKGAKYWDHAWNPMIGCCKISDGCANCYAERMAGKFAELQDGNGGFLPHPPKNLKSPPKSGVVFVGNMTDIFGEWNTDEQINNWFSQLNKDAVNLVLTKRTHRLRNKSCFWGHINVGFTAENQAMYNIRQYDFTCFEQENKGWLSAEPLLGYIRLLDPYGDPAYDWVVVGAESGPKRRPCKLEWVRGIVQQCQNYGIPVFVKQLDIGGKLETDIRKFPEDLQIRQVPWKK